MPILLHGEQGTHKNVLARTLHAWSSRGQGPFVRINCTLPVSVLEGELFGYVHTALHRANVGQKGAFEAADQGTLYLDQINSLPSRLQSRILRIMQNQAVERHGDYCVRTVDVRLLASSSTTLAHLLDRGLFRSDLFYRINRFPIGVPSLRDRPEDIETLLSHALQLVPEAQGGAVKFTPQALHLLRTYDWPGNIRELEALAAKIVISHQGGKVSRRQLQDLLDPASEFSSQAQAWSAEETPPLSIQDLEKKAILSALRRHSGSQNRAARELGISPRQLGYRIRKYGLKDVTLSLRRCSGKMHT